MPCALDGWLFRAYYMGGNYGSLEFTWEGWWEYLHALYKAENWRLAQLVAPFYIGSPVVRTVCAVIGGVCATAIVSMLARFMSPRPRLWAFVASWIVLTLFMPWRDHLLEMVYGLNFFVPGAFGMWFLLRLSRDTDSWCNLWAEFALLCCIILGHEIIALSIICGYWGYLILNFRTASKRNWLLGLAMIAVELPVLLTTYIVTRFARESEMHISLPFYQSWVYYIFPMVVAIFGYLLALVLPRYRRRALGLLSNKLFVVASGSALAMAVIAVQGIYCARHGMWSILASLVSIIIMWRTFSLPRLHLRPVVRKVALAVSVGVLIWFWTLVAYYQYRISVEYYAYTELAATHRTPVLQIQLDYLPNKAPMYLLGIPSRNLLNNPFDRLGIHKNYPHFNVMKPVVVDTLGNEYPRPHYLTFRKLFGLDE